MLIRRNRSLPTLTSPFDMNLDRLFREAFEGITAYEPPAAAGGNMPVNVWEDENTYHVEAELPGFGEKDVELSVLGNELRIEAKVDEQKEEKDEKGKLLRRERWTGTTSRVLRFAVDLEESKVQAKFEHGLLTVTLPKAKAALPRRIEIRG